MASFQTMAVVMGMGLLQMASVAHAWPACNAQGTCDSTCSFCEDDMCMFDASSTDCDDGNPCTRDFCQGLDSCQHFNYDDYTDCGGTGRDEKCIDGICVLLPAIRDDPHMTGFHKQKIDWRGEDGGWYVLISEADTQMSVRLTAPLPEDFPERQLVTGLSIMYGDGHSLVIETKNPYTTETAGCPDDWYTPCLSEGSLRITVDGKEQEAVTTARAQLPGVGAYFTATNLPAECQPYGGEIIWANKAKQMEARRELAADAGAATAATLTDTAVFDLVNWVSTWSSSVAAPSWCEKFMTESGAIGALRYQSKHTVFSIETPTLTLRLHHGTNHQGGEVLIDSRVLPALEFWQMDMHFERYKLDENTVTGILGETMRPVLDKDGVPVMWGPEALRGEVEDYRVSGPLAKFMGTHEGHWF